MTLRLVLALLLLSTGHAFAQTFDTGGSVNTPRVACGLGYSPKQCAFDAVALQRVLGHYPSHRLGDWTWILIRSQDWKALKTHTPLNPESPAFSSLSRRQTFIEEALVAPVPGRSMELVQLFGMSTNDLLTLAVTHEMGHGLCGEKDEHKADAYGRLLRSGQEVTCSR